MISPSVNTYKMKPKSLHLEAYTIFETARKLGYKSTKTIYRLLNRDFNCSSKYFYPIVSLCQKASECSSFILRKSVEI